MIRRTTIAITAAVLALALAGPAQAQTGAVTPLPTQWQRTVNVTAFWWQDLSGPRFDRWLTRARTQAGATMVSFVVTWYQDTPLSTSIHPSYGTRRTCARIGSSWRHCKTPSMRALRAAIRAARRQGLQVAIRPQVDVGRSAGTAGRRELVDIRGSGRRAWFRSYSNLLSQYGRLARDTGARTLVIGADLDGMTNEAEDLDYWHHLAADLRSGALFGERGKGFTGELTYAQSWRAALADAADPQTHGFVWGDLDEIGIDAYFPLIPVTAPHDDPPVADLVAGWTTPAAAVTALHEEYDRPVVFTGLGYLSRMGTSTAPENGDAQQKAAGGGISQGAQAHAVEAAFDVWSSVAGQPSPWFRGIWWWEWPASGRGGTRDGSHSLQGKSAQQVLCRRHKGSADASCPVPARVP